MYLYKRDLYSFLLIFSSENSQNMRLVAHDIAELNP